jgi:hypothetical protein
LLAQAVPIGSIRGAKVIDAFNRLEATLVRELEPDLACSGISPLNLLSGFSFGPARATHRGAR